MSSSSDTSSPVLDDSGTAARAGSPEPSEARSGLTQEQERIAAGVITRLAGPQARLRPDQETAVAALTRPGARALVVQATGWGKSAVYWAATALRRAAGAGPTLVVSPLLSLMADQVAAAERAGLVAVTVNSGNLDAWGEIEASIRADEVDVLLVSPERLANPGFGRRVLEGLRGRLGLLVVDEAHSVSDWGHDFRPDYRRVADTWRDLDPDCPVLATTATANARVTEDIARQLGPATLVLRGPLARSSLQLVVLPELDPLARYAWVIEHLRTLPGSGIVYALTVADAERLAEAVRRELPDVPVAAYTGRLTPQERARLEQDLRGNRVKALVATSALGMGFDKPDLGFVVHVGSPPSPVSYYQQVGRAGRGIDHALVALLPSRGDEGIWEHFATATLPDPEQVRAILSTLEAAAPEALSVVALEAQTGVRRGRVELLTKQLAVDGCVERVEGGWVRTDRPWEYDAAHYDGIVAVRRREADIMRDYIAGRDCLMALLQRSLDDPAAQPCGRCSVCLGRLPDGLSEQPAPDLVMRVGAQLRTRFHELEPRKMWPGAPFGRRGRIPAGEAAAPGRVLIHADAPEWRGYLQEFARDETSQVLLDHAVSVLADWKGSWETRPEVVVALDAEGHPRVTESLAEHLAAVGRLDRAGLTLAPNEATGESEAGGGAEAAMWARRLDVPEAEAQRLAGRQVLLVVDSTSTGWVVTVAASLLRSHGARGVLPLLIYRRP
ncbi:RecQ family ATP-dependent DNA helicase [Mobilicoccus caccae]|uniref:DNA 3'-5' helicase n=1 Tax=Mobilicoccus caccae TaxID=1859295 RepID=A0ABQ6IS50_9MICO|nr:DEAD/DEAH box helicase [Mobilicoccus caccae]GMA39547.1 ATP-dependent DNA helicase RecQ [Mobilicoccus caccae]